jgi:hypothetical protein
MHDPVLRMYCIMIMSPYASSVTLARNPNDEKGNSVGSTDRDRDRDRDDDDTTHKTFRDRRQTPQPSERVEVGSTLLTTAEPLFTC